MRAAIAVAAVLGGLCWVAAGLVADWVDPLSVAGSVLLAVAVVGAGASLASRSATWLRLVAGVCSLALVASVVLMVRDAVDDPMMFAAAGAVATIAGVVALARRPASAHRGTHAA